MHELSSDCVWLAGAGMIVICCEGGMREGLREGFGAAGEEGGLKLA